MVATFIQGLKVSTRKERMRAHMDTFFVDGFPQGIDETEEALCRSRLLRAIGELSKQTGLRDIQLRVGTTAEANDGEKAAEDQDGEWNLADRAARYRSIEPLWKSEELIVPDTVWEELQSAMEMSALEPLVFDIWGLREIEPFPRFVLNFHGPPGTGKTFAAHAVASAAGKKILVADYAQIESKFHGDGPKNVEALFLAAQRDEAVLFIDEADSLLSRRLTSVTQGSEQAINSMRSQLLICLEKHKGIVIFATNLVENYDPAFETRVRHIRFPLPDFGARARMWSNKLRPKLPLDADVNVLELATRSETLCGRDIKNAIVDAAMRVAKQKRNTLRQSDLLSAVDRIFLSRKDTGRGQGENLSEWVSVPGQHCPGTAATAGNS